MDLKQYVDYEGNYHLDDEYTYNEYEFYNDDDQMLLLFLTTNSFFQR